MVDVAGAWGSIKQRYSQHQQQVAQSKRVSHRDRYNPLRRV
jgi:ribosomal protein L20